MPKVSGNEWWLKWLVGAVAVYALVRSGIEWLLS